MSVYEGVVSNRVVILPEGVTLAEGLKVEVRVPIARRKRTAQRATEEQFKKRLIQMGLLSEIRLPPTQVASNSRVPIQVTGKPLSQTIIEERR